MIRLNITLPEEIARKLAKKHNKSRFIAIALKEKLERERREKMEKLLLEGYRETSEEDAALCVDWEKADREGWD